MAAVLDTNQRGIDEIQMNELKSPDLSPQYLLAEMKQTECDIGDEGQGPAPSSSFDPSCPDLVPDLDDIIRSFGSRAARKSSAFNRLSQKTIMSYEDQNDPDGLSSGTSSYNSGFSSSSDSTISSGSDPIRKQTDRLNADILTMLPSNTIETVDVSTKANENLIRVSKLNKRKATRSTERTPILPFRSRRLGKSRPTLMTNVDSFTQRDGDPLPQPSAASNTNVKYRIRSTSKSIAHFWTRKMSVDPITSVSSKTSNVAARKDVDIAEPVDASVEEHHCPATTGLAHSTLQISSTNENVSNDKTQHKPDIKLREKGKVIGEARRTFTSQSLTSDRADHFMERFDCDTGEIVAEGGFKSLLEPIIRGFDCDSGELVTAQELSAAQILSQDLRNSCPNDATLAFTAESEGAALLNIADRIDVSRAPPSPISVIENMELIFSESDVKGIKNLLRDSVDSSVSSISTNSSFSLSRSSREDAEHNPVSDESGSSAESASLSDRHKARHLRTTKVLVRKSNKAASRSLVSSSLSVTYTLPLNMRGVVIHRAVSILLVQPVQKVFEIVSVDVTRSTLLKDTLKAACLAAANPVLARQNYVCLCGDSKVLTNMTSPMSKLMALSKPARGMQSSAMNQNQDEPDILLRREMEQRLLVAVPEKSNATECQTIRRILWKNPKLQVWWNMEEIRSDDFMF
jgi:hypothetical protein